MAIRERLGWHTGRVTRSQEVAEQIEAMIRSGRLARGDMAPSVRDLMAGWGDIERMSDSTAKTALKQLADARLIEARPSVGHIVISGQPRPTVEATLSDHAERLARLEAWRAEVEAREAD